MISYLWNSGLTIKAKYGYGRELVQLGLVGWTLGYSREIVQLGLVGWTTSIVHSWLLLRSSSTRSTWLNYFYSALFGIVEK